MKAWAGVAGAAVCSMRVGITQALKAIVTDFVRTTRALLCWHRERMASDPLYPVALAAGGGALIQVMVPSLAVGNALRTVLHTLLGTSTPGLYGGSYGREHDMWEDE